MPDAVTFLELEHFRVERLFDQFEDSPDHALALQICQDLTVHAQLEEDIVYPLLNKIAPDFETEARQEHAVAKQLIAKIKIMGPDDPMLAESVVELREAVSHHVEEEESQAFPKLKGKMGDELEELGAVLTVRKQELRRRDEASRRSLVDLTKEELYDMAKKADIDCRSTMTKDQLLQALRGR